MRNILFLMAVIFFSPAQAYAERQVTIADILKQVYESNPSLLAAREELNETMELYPQARAGWLPSLNAETSIYATDIDTSNFAGGDGATTKDMTVSLDQPIWQGGRTFSETAEARDLIRAGQAVLRKEEQKILLDALTAYLDVKRDREILALRRRNENNLQQEYEAAKERLELGEITKTGVAQAEARLARAEADRIGARRDLETSAAKFVAVTNMQPPETMSAPPLDFEFPGATDDVMALAEQQNYDLIIARFRHKAAEHNADSVFRELLPQLSAFASWNRQYDPQPGIISETQTETVGLRATLAVFQGGILRSDLRKARAKAKQQEYGIDAVRDQVRQDVTRNLRSYEASKKQVKSRHVEIKAAKAALEGVREESRIGQRTLLDVLEADEDLIAAKIALAQARRNEAVAAYALANVLGFDLYSN